jgi:hypothetical protein
VGDPINPNYARVIIDLIDDEKAIALATKIAHQLKKTVIVSDATGRQVCIAPIRRKLDS